MHALAGMPMLTFTELGKLRVEALSFFLLLFFLSAAGVMWIWNSLRRDFVRLPRLGYFKALGMVTLWAFAFGLVLTMISGARELLTPGAWEKDGATYRLVSSRETTAQAKSRENEIRAQRYVRMEALKSALWSYARTRAGRFPADSRDPAIPSSTWETADPSRARYEYIPGRIPNVGTEVIVHEPTNVFDSVMTLTSAGEIRAMSAEQLKALLRPAGASAEAAR